MVSAEDIHDYLCNRVYPYFRASEGQFAPQNRTYAVKQYTHVSTPFFRYLGGNLPCR